MLEERVLSPAFFPRYLALVNGYFVSVRDFSLGQLVFRYNETGELLGADTLALGTPYYSYLENNEPRLASLESVFGESTWTMRTVLYEFTAQGVFADSVVLRESELETGESYSGHAFHYVNGVLTCLAASVIPSQTINDFRVWLLTYDGNTVTQTEPWDPGPLPLHSYVTSWGILRTTDSRFVLSAFIRGDDNMEFWFLGLESDATSNSNIHVQQVDANHLLNGLTMLEYSGSLIYAFTEVTTDGSFGGGAQIAAFPLNQLLSAPQSMPELPSKLDLAVYPNPFNATATIDFTIAQPGLTSLAIYDVLGRKVSQLADEMLQSGRHLRTWSAPNSSSGNYFLRLMTRNETRVIPLILAK